MAEYVDCSSCDSFVSERNVCLPSYQSEGVLNRYLGSAYGILFDGLEKPYHDIDSS